MLINGIVVRAVGHNHGSLRSDLNCNSYLKCSPCQRRVPEQPTAGASPVSGYAPAHD